MADLRFDGGRLLDTEFKFNELDYVPNYTIMVKVDQKSLDFLSSYAFFIPILSPL